MQPRSNPIIRLAVACLLAAVAWCGAEARAEGPLAPPDRSTPQAAVQSFLQSIDETLELILEYKAAPSRARRSEIAASTRRWSYFLDLSETPRAVRNEVAVDAAVALYEVLCRIDLPPLQEVEASAEDNDNDPAQPERWVVPFTEITLIRTEDGAADAFRFSPATVARAREFLDRVKELPYERSPPGPSPLVLRREYGGWMIPPSIVDDLPTWARWIAWGHPIWKWAAFAALLGASLAIFVACARLLRWRSEEHRVRTTLLRLAVPLLILGLVKATAYLSIVQINMIGSVADAVIVGASVMVFLCAAAAVWFGSSLLAELTVGSTRHRPESINANLIVLFAKMFGLIGVVALLLAGAERIGVPLYGVIAGLGVGGLAVALAAQPTIENLMGSLNLFADRPVRVGDFCQYGTDLGTVESIGLRSTRIRGIDRTLTTIPNSSFSRMPIINYTCRDHILLRVTINLRYETTAEQLRFVLARLREMLLGHPCVRARDMRVRFSGFGASSLDVEIFAYVKTTDFAEFLGIQEDVFLRAMDIVGEAGTGFAFPSRTVYLSRDQNLDAQRREAAERRVASWRASGKLPFPNFPTEALREIRGTVDFPPRGSPDAVAPEHAVPDGQSVPPNP